MGGKFLLSSTETVAPKDLRVLASISAFFKERFF
jgi:hypothetical protein